LWVLDQMNRFIEHSQVVITTKCNTVTAFHNTNHSALIYSVYFHSLHYNAFTVTNSFSDLRRLSSPIQSLVWSDLLQAFLIETPHGSHRKHFCCIVEKECFPLGCLVTSYNVVFTTVAYIRCCENIYGVVA
jgi:hypothetical protein